MSQDLVTPFQPVSAVDELKQLASAATQVTGTVDRDHRGHGQGLNQFETQIASLVGKDAGMFCVSGAQAQLIAARIHSDDTRNVKRVAVHPGSRMRRKQLDALEHIWGFTEVRMGDPNRVISSADVLTMLNSYKFEVSMIVLELPQTEVGGATVPWDDLVRISLLCRHHRLRLHLDGSRLWEVQPYYQVSFGEICNLFDSVYVSFASGIGAMAGSMLCGNTRFVQQARIWQQRLGGIPKTLLPYEISARQHLELNFGSFAARHEKLRKVVELMTRYFVHTGWPMRFDPPEPQSCSVHVYLLGKRKYLELAKRTVLENHNILLFGALKRVPQYKLDESQTPAEPPEDIFTTDAPVPADPVINALSGHNMNNARFINDISRAAAAAAAAVVPGSDVFRSGMPPQNLPFANPAIPSSGSMMQTSVGQSMPAMQYTQQSMPHPNQQDVNRGYMLGNGQNVSSSAGNDITHHDRQYTGNIPVSHQGFVPESSMPPQNVIPSGLSQPMISQGPYVSSMPHQAYATSQPMTAVGNQLPFNRERADLSQAFPVALGATSSQTNVNTTDYASHPITTSYDTRTIPATTGTTAPTSNVNALTSAGTTADISPVTERKSQERTQHTAAPPMSGGQQRDTKYPTEPAATGHITRPQTGKDAFAMTDSNMQRQSQGLPPHTGTQGATTHPVSSAESAPADAVGSSGHKAEDKSGDHDAQNTSTGANQHPLQPSDQHALGTKGTDGPITTSAHRFSHQSHIPSSTGMLTGDSSAALQFKDQHERQVAAANVGTPLAANQGIPNSSGAMQLGSRRPASQGSVGLSDIVAQKKPSRYEYYFEWTFGSANVTLHENWFIFGWQQYWKYYTEMLATDSNTNRDGTNFSQQQPSTPAGSVATAHPPSDMVGVANAQHADMEPEWKRPSSAQPWRAAFTGTNPNLPTFDTEASRAADIPTQHASAFKGIPANRTFEAQQRQMIQQPNHVPDDFRPESSMNTAQPMSNIRPHQQHRQLLEQQHLQHLYEQQQHAQRGTPREYPPSAVRLPGGEVVEQPARGAYNNDYYVKMQPPNAFAPSAFDEGGGINRGFTSSRTLSYPPSGKAIQSSAGVPIQTSVGGFGAPVRVDNAAPALPGSSYKASVPTSQQYEALHAAAVAAREQARNQPFYPPGGPLAEDQHARQRFAQSRPIDFKGNLRYPGNIPLAQNVAPRDIPRSRYQYAATGAPPHRIDNSTDVYWHANEGQTGPVQKYGNGAVVAHDVRQPLTGGMTDPSNRYQQFSGQQFSGQQISGMPSGQGHPNWNTTNKGGPVQYLNNQRYPAPNPMSAQFGGPNKISPQSLPRHTGDMLPVSGNMVTGSGGMILGARGMVPATGGYGAFEAENQLNMVPEMNSAGPPHSSGIPVTDTGPAQAFMPSYTEAAAQNQLVGASAAFAPLNSDPLIADSSEFASNNMPSFAGGTGVPPEHPTDARGIPQTHDHTSNDNMTKSPTAAKRPTKRQATKRPKTGPGNTSNEGRGTAPKRQRKKRKT